MLLLTTNAKDISIHPDDWPRCAKCDMPVQEFKIVDCGYSTTLVAACHGADEIIDVPDEILANVFGGYVRIGLAFDGP
jgi:hypothetical protein